MSLFQGRSLDFVEVQIDSSEEKCLIESQERIFHILSEFLTLARIVYN